MKHERLMGRGGSKIRLIRQSEISECGLASLTMIANYHGMNVDLASMRRRFGLSMRGAALRTLMNIADQIGLSSRAVGLPLQELANLQLPAILHWNFNHFVVVEAVRPGMALIHDPDGRSGWRPIEQVSRHFTGVALELRPTLAFEPRNERQRLSLRQLCRGLPGLGSALAQTLVLSLVLQLFALVSPYYMQLAIDKALPALDYNLLAVLALGFGLFTLVNAGAALIRAYVLLNAGSSAGFLITVNVARRLMRLPIEWFERRNTGDILSRFQSVMPIQQVLTEGAVASLVDGSLAVLTAVVMFIFSPVLAALALGAVLLYSGVRVLLFRLERDGQEASIVAAAKEQTTLIESLRGITSLRLFGQEGFRHALWQSRRADAVNADLQLGRLAAWQGVANMLIFGIESVLSVWIAVTLIMGASGFSLGMTFAFFAYKLQFTQKWESLINQFVRFRMLGLHLERLADIALAEEDRSFRETGRAMASIDGAIELRDISYRYSPADPLVLDRLSFRVSAGEHVAITGPSGGGKSTLIKILMGLLEPDSGEMLVDDIPLRQIGLREYRRHIAGVLQDDYLFQGSIADNIALFDTDAKPDQVEEVARLASIHDDIVAMPMSYDTLVGDMGSTLSGGQKQRVLLARALYKKPNILILDEGTSHLDAAHEHTVNQSLAALSITRIVVAHRRETIAAADRVLRLDCGILG